MGSTVVRGEVEATVQATGTQTFFGKTAKLINDGDEEVRDDMYIYGIYKCRRQAPYMQ
jgi:magnesium-transporting ATPase (P-type)